MAASASPAAQRDHSPREQKKLNGSDERPAQQKRAARIIRIARDDSDERALERRQLLDRLMTCEGRGAITRAADAFRERGFEFPVDQEVQLQLLEHVDDELVRGAIEHIARLIRHEPPLKKPILDQRLRRIEEYSEDEPTRRAAAELRRVIRSE